MYMSVLSIDIESYGHVLGPPRVSNDSKKNVFKAIFNDLIENFEHVKRYDLESVFGMYGLVFNLRALPSHQDPLFPFSE